MNRRSFLKFTSIGAALLGGGVLLSESFTKSISDVSFQNLPANIQALYSQEYMNALPDLSLEDLIVRLREKGIYRQGEFNISQIQSNSNKDSILKFNDFYYTQSELFLYSIVARLHAENETEGGIQATTKPIVELAGVDFMGGDLRDFKTIAGSSSECEKACEDELKCNAYTYAKTSHPIPSKQGHCWLKRESFSYKKDSNYISGIKK
jgi:hypothetical protein